MGVTDIQRKCWNEYGYIVIEEFFGEREVGAIEDSLKRTWNTRPANVTVDDLTTGERRRASEVSDAELGHPFKVNDLYLTDQRVRSVISSDRVVSLIAELLEDQPVVCNTLNLERGSQQPDHLDTLYMTPRSEPKLVATWMALEDAQADAGPLRYWPGSHRIDPYRFSTGSLHVVPEEMDDWADYMANSVEQKGLADEIFLAHRGDLFIWNALLLHGGSPIANPELTRSSLVTHFWSKADCDAGGLTTQPAVDGAGLWWDRPQQPIPGETMSAVEEELAERREAEQIAVTDRSTGSRRSSLFERLRSLKDNPGT
jgi:ectoine hydroxylase-related dioxygenase (phytanoyl-CoA dioxygenase family)